MRLDAVEERLAALEAVETKQNEALADTSERIEDLHVLMDGQAAAIATLVKKFDLTFASGPDPAPEPTADGMTASEVEAMYRDCPECRDYAAGLLRRMGRAIPKIPVAAARTVRRMVQRTMRVPCATCPSGYRVVTQMVPEEIQVAADGCPCGCGDADCNCQAGQAMLSGSGVASATATSAPRASRWFPGKIVVRGVRRLLGR